ncbi:MAG: hypothetical protein V1867_05220 [Candidatus Falkowbacteria bacterium]
MKNHAKVGNRNGRPGYRTPSGFRANHALKVGGRKERLPFDNFSSSPGKYGSKNDSRA